MSSLVSSLKNTKRAASDGHIDVKSLIFSSTHSSTIKTVFSSCIPSPTTPLVINEAFNASLALEVISNCNWEALVALVDNPIAADA